MIGQASSRRSTVPGTQISGIGASRLARIKKRIGRIVQKSLQRPIVIDRDPDGQLPGAFIIAPPGSGAGLLRSIFDSHPEIAAPPGTSIFPHLLGALREERVTRAMWNAGFHREFLALSLGDFGRSFIEAYAATERKRLWIEETPSHVEWLPELSEACPDAKFLMLYRHPFDVVGSMMEHNVMETQPRFAVWRRNHRSSFAACCAYVAAQHGTMRAFEAEHGDVAHSIRYERLALDAETELAAACAFLGVELAAQMLDSSSTSHDRGSDDGKISETGAIVPRVGTFGGWSEDEKVEAASYLQESLDALGYRAGSVDQAGSNRSPASRR